MLAWITCANHPCVCAVMHFDRCMAFYTTPPTAHEGACSAYTRVMASDRCNPFLALETQTQSLLIFPAGRDATQAHVPPACRSHYPGRRLNRPLLACGPPDSATGTPPSTRHVSSDDTQQQSSSAATGCRGAPILDHAQLRGSAQSRGHDQVRLPGVRSRH